MAGLGLDQRVEESRLPGPPHVLNIPTAENESKDAAVA
jgi:hypothetical protein